MILYFIGLIVIGIAMGSLYGSAIGFMVIGVGCITAGLLGYLNHT